MDLLAIVGRQGSGKDTVASYLVHKYSFAHISSGDVLRKYVRDNNLGKTDRDNLQHIVTELRASRGNDILIKSILDDPPSQRLIISGLRHPDEVKLIRKHHGRVLAVVADPDIRYKRSVKRQREGDEIEFDEFKRLEEREKEGKIWRVDDIIAQADMVVQNGGRLDDLHVALDQHMAQLGLGRGGDK